MDVAAALNAAFKRIPSWPLYIMGVAPVVWLFYQAITGNLGVDPVKKIEHQMGLWGLWLLIVGLSITPLCRLAGLRLMKYRRAIGVLTFFYILVHLLVWLVLDVQILSQVWQDILKRPYITIGMAGFVLLVPLALTSNNWSVRKMGSAAWRRLHKLTYAIAILGSLHFVMLVKGWQVEPLIYMVVILTLLMLRSKIFQRRPADVHRPAKV
ncbi:protein-methionine-sulfoxide reductase heme-binding subunit MsrQ [Actibacterium sp. 188UL27-1]|uniref:protein-methionine-sulfoxide reductase heme-binding subunit MsrQ n=1 Tax=Actibacterium sp. 188UL27-1 TaxID=2786961 RepID=UPI001957EE16|nr:protein-methionine-sulfoxide reductase heme-binding subunit MsrQ [Actibacterium sp. 188UL27-1]MBM7070165.1 protein-methionine-sulfoxide reductase heme-binding subunit MsrQ [Actibacterium sp. 188UL27-1]